MTITIIIKGGTKQVPKISIRFSFRLTDKPKMGLGMPLHKRKQNPFLKGLKLKKNGKNGTYLQIGWTINTERSCKNHENRSRRLAKIVRETDRITKRFNAERCT